MTKQVVIPERRDVKRMIEGILETEKRNDVLVNVMYFVQLGIDRDIGLSTIINPLDGFTRGQARPLVKAMLEQLNKLEKEILDARSRNNQLPGGSPGILLDTNVDRAVATAAAKEKVVSSILGESGKAG